MAPERRRGGKLRTSRVTRPAKKQQPPTTATSTTTPPNATARPAARPQRDPDPGFVAVGRVLAPFGLKGELKVQALTDNPARFAKGARLYAGRDEVTVADVRSASGALYLRLRGHSDRTAVERFRHAILQIPETELPALAKGEYYRFQLIGLRVVDASGVAIGTLDEVIETGANDVYRVRRADGTDLLIPALDDAVLNIDLDAGTMTVDPPDWR
jgi:16S rRNA processing protein RimM